MKNSVSLIPTAEHVLSITSGFIRGLFLRRLVNGAIYQMTTARIYARAQVGQGVDLQRDNANAALAGFAAAQLSDEETTAEVKSAVLAAFTALSRPREKNIEPVQIGEFGGQAVQTALQYVSQNDVNRADARAEARDTQRRKEIHDKVVGFESAVEADVVRALESSHPRDDIHVSTASQILNSWYSMFSALQAGKVAQYKGVQSGRRRMMPSSVANLVLEIEDLNKVLAYLDAENVKLMALADAANAAADQVDESAERGMSFNETALADGHVTA